MSREIYSSSSPNQTRSYDVFVSFYGKDTRLSFTDHLFAALHRSGIHTFRDDRKLRRGKDIKTELEKAIKSSKIAIIVFSRNYVASRWCLDELEKIMECKRDLRQIVLPVFYKLDPSELRTHKERLAEVFLGHKDRFGEDKVARWRAALTEAASLAGWDSQNVAHRFESKLIKEIIEDISSKLNLPYFMVAPHPVGIEPRVQELKKLLSRGSNGTCMLGIWGVGGIGKTTIAKAIYNHLQERFEASCFLENVRENAKLPNGLIDLQEQILSNVHVNDNRKIKHVDQGTMLIKNRAWCRRVLAVFDDVDHWDQLHKLAIRRDYFQPGSIIIITTRDKSMLKLDEINEIYTPLALDDQESIQLLSWHAFRKDHPKENYIELSKEVIHYVGGLPLALQVLGSLLSDKSTNEWEDTLKKLRVIPHDEIQKKLIVSFDSLSDTQKELFLDIACFFVGMENDYTSEILQDSNPFLKTDLGVLVRLCLVTIDCSNQLTMHDMIRDMGREVVRRKSPTEPGKRSRLWFYWDVLEVLKYHTGTKIVECITLNSPEVCNLQVNSRAFAKMHRLRVLQLNYARLEGNFQCPSKRLSYLEWYEFPMKYIPADLYMENLVALYMPYSSLIELWTGTKILKKLKFLDVCHSYHLRTTPDFLGITNLEVLVLNNCTSLVEVHESIVCLDKLVTLDLADCKNLTKLPLGIYELKSLVNLSGCTKLDMVQSFKFESPFIPRCSNLICFTIYLDPFDFLNKLRQNKDFSMGCGIRETVTRHSKSAATHHPLPRLKEREVDVEVLDTPTFASELEEFTVGCGIKETATRHSESAATHHPQPILKELEVDVKDPDTPTFASELEIPERLNHCVWGATDFIVTTITNLQSHSYHIFPTPSREILLRNPHGPLIDFRNTLVSITTTNCQMLVGSRQYRVPFIFNLIKQLNIPPSLCERFALFDEAPIALVIFYFLKHVKLVTVLVEDELPIGLQGANNRTSFEWILTGLNWELSEFGCSKLLNEYPASIPRTKLLEEFIATNSPTSFFLPGGAFPDWLDYKSTGSILSFVVPPLARQRIQGWFLCVVFASRFHDIHGFTVTCQFKINIKGIKWQYKQKNCHVKPCQELLWLHSAPLQHMADLLEARDEVKYSIHISGGFQVKKFGVNLIYENDKMDYPSCFEAMIENASLTYQDEFLDEDVSTDQAMAVDKKIHPSDLQMSGFNDEQAVNEDGGDLIVASIPLQDFTIGDGINATTTSCVLDKQRRLGSVASHYPSHCHLPPKDISLAEVEDLPSEGNRQRASPYFHEDPQGTPSEQNLYSLGIPTTTYESQIERLRSLEAERMLWEAERKLWEAERQLLLHQLQTSRADAAGTSEQQIIRNTALERENFFLRTKLAHYGQFAPRLASESASSLPASTQSTVAAIVSMASTRPNTLGLDSANFPARPVNDPSISTPPTGGSHLPQ